MADYFVDHTASPGGNGLSPGSAYISLTSIAWANGDVAWLRRTHVASFAAADQPFNVSTAGGNALFTAVVGWPDSLDPFYDRRPAAGVSAGWDADLPATAAYSIFGYKFPTLSASNANVGSCPGYGLGVVFANICFNQLGTTANQMPVRNLGPIGQFNNVLICQSYSFFTGRGTSARFPLLSDKLIFCFSFGGSDTPLFTTNDVMFIDHLVIPPQSAGYCGVPVSGNGGFSYFGVVENQSNSIAYMVSPRGSQDSNYDGAVVRIRRAVGVQPFSGFVEKNPNTNTRYGGAVCDDYFGLGPYSNRLGGASIGYRLATSLEAMHNGSRAMYVQVPSVNGLTIGYRNVEHVIPLMRKNVTVVSGTPLNIELPVYVDSTAVWSVNGFTAPLARLIAAGGKSAYPSTVAPGSAGLWVGSLCAAGSAWIMRYTLPVAESGSVPLEIELPQITNASSGASINPAYMLVSEPYSV